MEMPRQLSKSLPFPLPSTHPAAPLTPPTHTKLKIKTSQHVLARIYHCTYLMKGDSFSFSRKRRVPHTVDIYWPADKQRKLEPRKWLRFKCITDSSSPPFPHVAPPLLVRAGNSCFLLGPSAALSSSFRRPKALLGPDRHLESRPQSRPAEVALAPARKVEWAPPGLSRCRLLLSRAGAASWHLPSVAG